MDSLAKALRHFIVRDLVYVTGGAIILAVVMRLAGRGDIPHIQALKDLPFAFYLFAAAVAHLVGFAVADGAGMLFPGIFPTHPTRTTEPSKLQRKLFERMTSSQWQKADDTMTTDMSKNLSEVTAYDDFGAYHRLVMLRHVGAVGGSCALFAGLLALMVIVFRLLCHEHVWLVDASTLALIPLGCVLTLAGQMKSLQQADYLRRHYDELSRKWEALKKTGRTDTVDAAEPKQPASKKDRHRGVAH